MRHVIPTRDKNVFEGDTICLLYQYTIIQRNSNIRRNLLMALECSNVRIRFTS